MRLGCRMEGDGEIEITGVAGMEHAGPGDLTFLANPKYAHKVKDSRAAAIIVSEKIEAPLALGQGENLRLRVFVDGPVLEVFANERQCVTTQVYPALRESRQVKLCARGGGARLVGGEAWEMVELGLVDNKKG